METQKTNDRSQQSVPSPLSRGVMARPGKYGLKAIPTGKNAQEPHKKKHADGLNLLKKIEADYKAEMSKNRRKVFFKHDPSSIRDQEWYAEELDRNRRTTDGFLERIKKSEHLKINDKQEITYLGIRIASLLEGDNAYQAEPQKTETLNTVYKRISLDDTSQKDFVRLHGSYIRRHAHRAITPLERCDLKREDALSSLRPYNYGSMNEASKGLHFFDNGTSKVRNRAYDLDKDDPKTDVEFIAALTGIREDKFPAHDSTLLAYTQVRNGVNKVFSGRSTDKEIKSNHGASFSRFGEVTIDLAQMPEENVIHHYNVGRFDSGKVINVIEQAYGSTVPKSRYHNISSDIARANNSVVRNREILFTEIPFSAITSFRESPTRDEYYNGFDKAYELAYNRKFDELLKSCEVKNPNLYSKITNGDTTQYRLDFNTDDWNENLLYDSTAFTEDRGREDGNSVGQSHAESHYWAMIKVINDRNRTRSSFPAKSSGGHNYQTNNRK